MKKLSGALLAIVDSAEADLRGVTEPESQTPILAGGWSRKELVGHLIDSASNNHQRFVRAALGDSLEFPGYEQEGWQRLQAAQAVSWQTLLTLWRTTIGTWRTSLRSCPRTNWMFLATSAPISR